MKKYNYNGQSVFLEHEEYMSGVAPIDSECGMGCYPISAYRGTDTCLTVDEYYEGESEDESEIINTECVNPENDQKLLDGWWTKDYAEWDIINRELCMMTNRYCDWESALSSFLSRMKDEYMRLYNESELDTFDFGKWNTEWHDICDTYMKDWSADNPLDKPKPMTTDELLQLIIGSY